MIYSLDYPKLLDREQDEISSECEIIIFPRPPFVPGQRIYNDKYPWSGSLEVVSCEPYPDGGWCVSACDGNYRVVAPAEYYRSCPAGWTEPPMCPLEHLGYDDISRILRAEREHDTEYQERGNKWQQAMLDWLSELDYLNSITGAIS